LFLLGVILEATRHNPRYRPISFAYHDLFAVLNALQVGTELCLQFGDVNGAHGIIIANMTMLVIFGSAGIVPAGIRQGSGFRTPVSCPAIPR